MDMKIEFCDDTFRINFYNIVSLHVKNYLKIYVDVLVGTKLLE